MDRIQRFGRRGDRLVLTLHRGLAEDCPLPHVKPSANGDSMTGDDEVYGARRVRSPSTSKV